MISRGMPGAAEAAPVRLEPEPRLRAVPSEAAPRLDATVAMPQDAMSQDAIAADYQLVHFRLEALERLCLLRDKGALSSVEYECEKRLVLRLPADELDVAPDSLLPPPGPSLLGRIFGWKLILTGLAVGLGFVAFTAPQELAGLIHRFSGLFG